MKDPQDREGVELTEGEGLVRTTIVGGQPRKRPAIRMTVKVGLERVLYLAATDRAFRTAVLVNRTAALKAAGLSLSDGEAAILDAVGADALDAMIDAVAPRSRPQRPFLRSVAATFLTLATGTAQVGCEPPVSTGIEPDLDVYMQPDAGIDPNVDVPEVYPDAGTDPGFETNVPEVYPDAGIDPEIGDDNPFTTDELPLPAGILPDIPEMDADVPEVFPDTGITDDGAFDQAPSDVQIDSDAPVVGGILPDDPGMAPDPAADAPVEAAALPRPAPRGGRA